MGRCWPGAKLLENGRMRDALLNETLFLDLDRATDNRQLGRGLYHGEVAFLVLDYKTQALSAEHLTATGHDAAPPKLRVLAGRSHRAGKRTNAVVPTAAGWGSVAGNTCPTASAKSSCDDCSTCDQGIHAPPPTRLQRYFHAETVLRPRRHNPGTPAPPG